MAPVHVPELIDEGMARSIQHILTQFGVLASRPLAFAIVAAYGVLWCVLSPESFGWHGFAVMATCLMTLVIQRAEHRDTQAIQAKLDELLHTQRGASNHLTKLDEREPEEIEEHREDARRRD
jgi:low affinity Fe/Cu permease